MRIICRSQVGKPDARSRPHSSETMRMATLMHKHLFTFTGVKEHHTRRSTEAIPIPQAKQSLGRRRGLLSSSFLAFAAAFSEANDSRSALLQSMFPFLNTHSCKLSYSFTVYSIFVWILVEYLNKSQENKAKNDKEVTCFFIPRWKFLWFCVE